jgi:hypothetical protein
MAILRWAHLPTKWKQFLCQIRTSIHAQSKPLNAGRERSIAGILGTLQRYRLLGWLLLAFSCLRGLRCVYYAVMIHFFSTYAIRPAGLLLVSVFAASLFWCGDAACWSGASDGQCASLICSLLTRHNTSNETHNGDCSAACMCVCHTPTILEIDFDIEHHLPAHNTAFEFTASTPYSPARSIYRPPKS